MKQSRRRYNNGKLNKVMRFLLIMLISLLLGVNIYLWNAHKLVGNALPMPFGYGVSVVLSGSMEPELSVDDLVVLHRKEAYEVGDIVVYQHEDDLIIHRIISIDAETGKIQTQGEANNIPDDPIGQDVVKGKMIARVPGIGAVVRLLKTPAGSVLVLAAAFILLEFSYRRECGRNDREIEQIKKEIYRLREEDDDGAAGQH